MLSSSKFGFALIALMAEGVLMDLAVMPGQRSSLRKQFPAGFALPILSL